MNFEPKQTLSCNFKVKFGNLYSSYISTEDLCNPSNRKDCKGDVLAQICQKVGIEVVNQNATSIQAAFVILALARFEILDHCIYPSENHTRLP